MLRCTFDKMNSRMRSANIYVVKPRRLSQPGQLCKLSWMQMSQSRQKAWLHFGQDTWGVDLLPAKDDVSENLNKRNFKQAVFFRKNRRSKQISSSKYPLFTQNVQLIRRYQVSTTTMHNKGQCLLVLLIWSAQVLDSTSELPQQLCHIKGCSLQLKENQILTCDVY